MQTIQLIALPLIYTLVFLVIFFLTKKKAATFKPRIFALYVLFTAMIGPVGEIFVGSIYHALFGQLLWRYEIFPIHGGYTSYYAPVIWCVGGMVMYLLYEHLQLIAKMSTIKKLVFHTFETIIVEVLLNLTFLALSGGLIFYYLPGDLFHVSSLQTLPFYFLFAILIMRTIPKFHKKATFGFTTMAIILFVVVFLTK